MRLLRLAIEEQRWDLAAHTLVLATARLLSNLTPNNTRGENKRHVVKSKERRIKTSEG